MVFSLPRIKSLCRALWLFGLFLFLMPLAYAAQENPSQENAGTVTSGSENAEKNSKEFNAGEMIIEHIVDAHEWHIAEIGSTHISIPLPVILYSEKLWC